MAVRFFILAYFAMFSELGLALDILLTVNPTQVEAKRQEAVVLDCQGNTRNVLEYISKKVSWKHVANNGTIHKITTGFYLDDGADKTKYDIQHGISENSDTNYSFKLKIFSVVDDDDGKFVCENEDSNFTLLSSKEVRFIVVHPVEKVAIHLLSITMDRKMHSETQTLQNSEVHEVEEGDYEVTCIAEGSNPNPKMTLKFNNDSQPVEPNVEKSFVGNRPSFKGSLKKVLSLSADIDDTQTIECSGGIPRKQFPDKYAGFKLKVFAVVPEIECDNVYAPVNYRKIELTCRLHSIRSLDCRYIKWVDGSDTFIIYPGNKTHNSIYGTLIARCNYVTHENGTATVTTTLIIELVQDIHFHTEFLVEYFSGNHSYTRSVRVYKKEVSTAILVKPLGVLCTLLALFVRRISMEV